MIKYNKYSLQTAKIVFCKQNAIYSLNLKVLQGDLKDGETLDLQPKSIGNTDLYPTVIYYLNCVYRLLNFLKTEDTSLYKAIENL